MAQYIFNYNYQFTWASPKESFQEDLAFMDLIFSVGLDTIINIMIETFHVMDLLFYGIAVYEGYRFSFRRITEEELLAVSKE